MKFFQYVSEWVLRLIWANLLWITFTILGLGVFGFFPATIALFTVTRKWVQGDFETPVVQTFVHTYRKEFKTGNKIGFIFYLMLLFLFVDYRLAIFMNGFISLFISILIICLLVFLGIMLMYFFPVYVHYTFKPKTYIKQSIIHSFVSIPETLTMIVGLLLTGYLLYKMPGLTPFISVSLPCYWIMTFSMRRFQRMEEMLSK